MGRYELAGLIAGAGFASGDRLVVGSWSASPIGPFADVMWAATSGERTLFAPTERAAAFITAVYEFDRVEVVDLAVDASIHGMTVAAPAWSLELVAARRGRRIGFHRPAWFTRRVEGPVARLLMGVRTYGVSPHGVEEWYRADAWRRIESGRLTVDGQDQGALRDVDPPCRFGFSEPPRRPTITAVRPLLVDPTDRLAKVVG